MNKPTWWPECPWPKKVWPMTQEEYKKAIPDPHLRMGIEGFLMGLGWELAEEDIFKKMKEILLGEE